MVKRLTSCQNTCADATVVIATECKTIHWPYGLRFVQKVRFTSTSVCFAPISNNVLYYKLANNVFELKWYYHFFDSMSLTFLSYYILCVFCLYRNNWLFTFFLSQSQTICTDKMLTADSKPSGKAGLSDLIIILITMTTWCFIYAAICSS